MNQYESIEKVNQRALFRVDALCCLRGRRQRRKLNQHQLSIHYSLLLLTPFLEDESECRLTFNISSLCVIICLKISERINTIITAEAIN